MRMKRRTWNKSIMMWAAGLLCVIGFVCISPRAASAEEAIYLPVSGKVSLSGDRTTNNIQNGEFEFNIISENKEVVLEDSLRRVRAEGLLELGSFTFPSEGTYVFYVEQVNKGKAGYTYDEVPVRIIITVYRDVDDEINYQIMYMKNGQITEQIEFNNHYINPEEPARTAPVDASLTVRAESSSSEFSPLNEIRHTIYVKNTGNTVLEGIRLREYVPPQALYISHTGEGGNYGAIKGKEHATWFLASLQPGKEQSVTVTFRINKCISPEYFVTPRVLFEITGNQEIVPVNAPQDPIDGIDLEVITN